MNPEIIKNEKDYNKALIRADKIFNSRQGTPESKELELLLLLLRDYENKYHTVPLPVLGSGSTCIEKSYC